MVVDIFIRTYWKDIPWLNYALKSIHKNVTGFRHIIVAIPEGQGPMLKHLTAERVVEVMDLPEGYLGQQLTKMEAWRYTDAEGILYWDSDTVAMEPVDIQKEFIRGGLPIIYCTPYQQVGDAQCWQAPTEQAVGFHVPLEYMRRLPLLYRRDTVGDCCAYVERTVGKSLGPHMMHTGRFSEFNVIGAFAHRYREEEYIFLNTDHQAPTPSKVRQFWSWGGITPEVKAQLDNL
jgi:hypothetical protein